MTNQPHPQWILFRVLYAKFSLCIEAKAFCKCPKINKYAFLSLSLSLSKYLSVVFWQFSSYSWQNLIESYTRFYYLSTSLSSQRWRYLKKETKPSALKYPYNYRESLCAVIFTYWTNNTRIPILLWSFSLSNIIKSPIFQHTRSSYKNLAENPLTSVTSLFSFSLPYLWFPLL